MIDDLRIGVAGEHLVCADLIVKGYNAFLSDQGLPYDIIADINGKLMKIQVKTTRTHKPIPQRKKWIPSYFFSIKKCGKGGKSKYGNSVDFFAVVALDTKQVGYVSKDIMTETFCVRVDSFKGKYCDEMTNTKCELALSLKKDGLNLQEIGDKMSMSKSGVGKIFESMTKTKKKVGIYFSELTLESALKGCNDPIL